MDLILDPEVTAVARALTTVGQGQDRARTIPAGLDHEAIQAIDAGIVVVVSVEDIIMTVEHIISRASKILGII